MECPHCILPLIAASQTLSHHSSDMLSFRRLTLALCLASGLLLSCADAAPAKSTSSLCQISTADRSNPSKLPKQLQEASGTQPLELKHLEVNHFSIQVGKNNFGFTLDADGKVNIQSSFDNSHPRVHHHHLFEVTFARRFDPFEGGEQAVVTKYFYLKDDDKCHGQKDGVIPGDIEQVLSVRMLTLNE